MKASWTPERRAAQAERARDLHRRRRNGPRQAQRAKATLAMWRRIRRRPKVWHSIKRRTTVVPFLYGVDPRGRYGVDVQVLIAYTLNGCVQVMTRWRRVKVDEHGNRAPRWTREARQAQAARLALPGRRFPGQPREVLERGWKESARRQKLRSQWTPERRAEQSRVVRQRLGLVPT